MSTIKERLDKIIMDMANTSYYDMREMAAIIEEWNAAVKAIEGLICSHHCYCVVTADECRTCICANTCTKRAGWLVLAKMEGY